MAVHVHHNIIHAPASAPPAKQPALARIIFHRQPCCSSTLLFHNEVCSLLLSTYHALGRDNMKATTSPQTG